MSYAIEIAGLEKTYKKSWSAQKVMAVKGIDLKVETGEAFGFIGPNGAGKSSTIKIMMGLSAASKGSVRVFGLASTTPVARQRVGYVPENPYLQDYLTPYEILRMSISLHHPAQQKPKEHCMHWLERLDIAHVANKSVRTFSKGMTQRVVIAQALCINPRLLVLDEPLSGLDPIGRRDVVELLSEYKRTGGTLFFTSHVLHDVERLADRFGMIHEGVLKAVHSPSELAGGENLIQIRTFGKLPVEGMREDFSGRWIGEFEQANLWSQLEKLNSAGHILQEVRPALSLETAFMKSIEKN